MNASMDLLGLLAASQPWMQIALCAEVDPDCWFPESGGSTRPAKSICDLCDVKEDCLEYALQRERDGETVHGVWGGKSRKERLLMLGRPGERRSSRKVRDEALEARIVSYRMQGLPIKVVAAIARVTTRKVERVLEKQRKVAA